MPYIQLPCKQPGDWPEIYALKSAIQDQTEPVKMELDQAHNKESY